MAKKDKLISDLVVGVFSRATKAEIKNEEVLLRRIKARWVQQYGMPVPNDQELLAVLCEMIALSQMHRKRNQPRRPSTMAFTTAEVLFTACSL